MLNTVPRLLDESTLIGVDPCSLEEPFDLGVQLDRELDADTCVFHSNTIVLQRINGVLRLYSVYR